MAERYGAPINAKKNSAPCSPATSTNTTPPTWSTAGARAQRSRLEPFIKAARTIRAHRAEILAAIRLGLSNARLEGLNRRVRPGW